MKSFWALLRDDEATSAVEYGVVCALVIVSVVVSVRILGATIETSFTFVGASLEDSQQQTSQEF